MATIDERPDRPKPWRVRYRDLSGSQRTRSFRRKVDAERFRVWVLNEQMQGMWIDPQRGKTPVGEWAEHWFVTTTELRSSTRLRTRSVLDLQFTPGFRLLLMVGVCRCFPVVCGLFVVCHTCGLTARPQVVATSDEELFIALTEQADAAYAEEGYDASARYRCYAEVLSESLPQWMEAPDREMLAEAGVDPRSLAPGDEPQAVAVLAQAGLDAEDEASDHWLQSNFEQLQAVLACCSPIALLPAAVARAVSGIGVFCSR